MSELTKLEQAVMGKLLAGRDAALGVLRAQLEKISGAERQETGVGFFLTFRFDDPNVVRLGNDKLTFGDVVAEIPGVKGGVGFLLYVQDGLLHRLEGYTFGGEPWPSNVSEFKLSYAPALAGPFNRAP
jgi:hypothetical protein